MYNSTPYPNYSYNPLYASTLNTYHSGVPKVTGIEGAKAYPLGANDSIALFDANDNIFYLKTTDSAGFASYRTFRFTEETAVVMQESAVTRKEFDELKSAVQELIEKKSEVK